MGGTGRRKGGRKEKKKKDYTLGFQILAVSTGTPVSSGTEVLFHRGDTAV
jgi:hypothetical protein